MTSACLRSRYREGKLSESVLVLSNADVQYNALFFPFQRAPDARRGRREFRAHLLPAVEDRGLLLRAVVRDLRPAAGCVSVGLFSDQAVLVHVQTATRFTFNEPA